MTLIIGKQQDGVVDKVRRGGMSHPTEAPERRLKGKRNHLPKAKENPEGNAKAELEELLAYNKKPIPPIF